MVNREGCRRKSVSVKYEVMSRHYLGGTHGRKEKLSSRLLAWGKI
jgi:hypothetical protein